MTAEYEFIQIYQSRLFQHTLHGLFGNQPTEAIHRSASHILKLVCEPQEMITRILLLPPGGYTANSLTETNSHPEARYAKITIKGGIDPHRIGFSQVRHAIKYAYFTSRDVQTEGSEPYARINLAHPLYREQVKSAKETFFVVREDGEGFYHNLINLSNRWILLILDKFLTQRRELNFDTKIERLSAAEKETFNFLVKAISEKGDRIFQENVELVDRITSFSPERILPGLIEGLNFQETGNHEPCSIYALILKIGRQEPQKVLDHLVATRTARNAPLYYLDELIRKVQSFERPADH